MDEKILKQVIEDANRFEREWPENVAHPRCLRCKKLCMNTAAQVEVFEFGFTWCSKECFDADQADEDAYIEYMNNPALYKVKH